MKREDPLYFFPEHQLTDAELRHLLRYGSREQRAWAVSHLLRYAQWDDIWQYTTREEVREIFFDLELGKLREPWARILKVAETPVG